MHTDDNPSRREHPAEERIRLEELTLKGQSRRNFMAQAAAGGLSVFALSLLTEQDAAAQELLSQDAVVAESGQNLLDIQLNINGRVENLKLDPRVTLLDALRERLQMTGTKKGCDHGQCGACTVLIDGRRVLSCLTLAATCEGREVTTVEGLAQGDTLHPMQQAFIKHDAFQCGYCTPGQICSAVALLKEAEEGQASYVTENLSSAGGALSDEEIRERMSGNICRCGAYPNIVKAVAEVQSGRETAQTWNFHIKVEEMQA
ncbi:MAG TPA: 2Fe-2S iron-sulfur cluster binding domain-containing protein [Phycisphaerales bacterium]|nr:2Fe-2S iron-sulfur cluster binding domain-containing protein [Phycisphaerales bacterium]